MNSFDMAEKYFKESLDFNYNSYSITNLLSYGDFKDPFNWEKDYLSRKLTKIYLKEEKYKEAYETTQINDSLYNSIGCAYGYFERKYYIVSVRKRAPNLTLEKTYPSRPTGEKKNSILDGQ